MLRENVLRYKKDFSGVYKRGKSIGDRYVVLLYKKNNLAYNRIAFLASKKVGNSVKRNRARRLMKEGFRDLAIEGIKGYDLIIIARNSINGKKCNEVKNSIGSAIRRSKIGR